MKRCVKCKRPLQPHPGMDLHNAEPGHLPCATCVVPKGATTFCVLDERNGRIWFKLRTMAQRYAGPEHGNPNVKRYPGMGWADIWREYEFMPSPEH